MKNKKQKPENIEGEERILVDLSNCAIEEDDRGIIESFKSVVPRQFDVLLQARQRSPTHSFFLTEFFKELL